MYSISKEFTFSASHQLFRLPPDHPCSRLHGHNYVVRIELIEKTLTPVGFVVDYRDLDSFKQAVVDTLDHRHLNDIIPDNPTAENLARWFYLGFVQHYATSFHEAVGRLRISISETPKTWASYYEEADV